MECHESQQKTEQGAVDAPPRKRKTDDNNYYYYYEVYSTTKICVSISTRPKEHPSEPLKGTKPQSRQFQQHYASQRTWEEGSALGKRIEVDKADLENRRRQMGDWSKIRRRKAIASFRMSGSRQKKALIILTNIQKWFYFCRTNNLAFHDLMIGKVAPQVLVSLLGPGVKISPPLSSPRSTSIRA